MFSSVYYTVNFFLITTDHDEYLHADTKHLRSWHDVPVEEQGTVAMKICSNNIFGIEVAFQRVDKGAGTIRQGLAWGEDLCTDFQGLLQLGPVLLAPLSPGVDQLEEICALSQVNMCENITYTKNCSFNKY
jgi:hypothetical protein